MFLEKKPFPHWQLRDFLHTEPALIDKVERELIKYPGWNRKENDLYSLLQTPDLQTLDAGKYPAVHGFWYVNPNLEGLHIQPENYVLQGVPVW